MKIERVVLGDEVFVTLTSVAACYRVEVELLHEAQGYGLLGEARSAAGGTAISVQSLDRVAEVVRLRVHLGVGWEGILLLLD